MGRGDGWIRGLLSDLRVIFRQLRKSPGYTAVALATLTLGIGINTAIFAVATAYFLTPLPYHEPDRLLVAWEIQDDGETMTVSPGLWARWDSESRFVEETAAYNVSSPVLSGDGEPVRLRGSVVTPDFFQVLGVPPLLGPGFTPEDGTPGNEAVILSHSLWQQRYGGDPGVVGRTVDVWSTPHRVAGVMPPEFRQPERGSHWQRAQLWMAEPLDDRVEDFGSHYLRAVGRLAPGATPAQAQAELQTLARTSQEAHPDLHQGWSARVWGVDDYIRSEARPTLLLLLAGGGMVLLIVCANMANLVLARTQRRTREFALRAALGAPRLRLVRTVLLEALLVSVAGGILGLLLVAQARGLLQTLQERYVTNLVDVSVSPTVMLLTVFAAGGTAVLFGLVPAFRSARPDLRDALVEGGAGAGDSREAQRTRTGLVVGEVALTTVLLVGAGLLFRSLVGLTSVSPGFQVSDVLIFRVSPASGTYDTAESLTAYYRQLQERLEGLAQVTDVAAVSDLPFTSENRWNTLDVDDPGSEPRSLRTEYRTVDPGYFRTMGIPILRGTGFPEETAAEGPIPVLVNERLADLAWSGQDPMGRRLVRDSATTFTVVGVVGNVLDDGYAAEPEPLLYRSFQRWPIRSRYLMLRTRDEPSELAPQVRAAARELDQVTPLTDFQTLEELLASSVAGQRAASYFGLSLAVLALFLAALGIYGVLSYVVAARTREMGIRTALGARSNDVVALILRRSLAVAGLGVVVGAGGALILGRVLASALFGVRPWDPLTFAVTAGALMATAALASWIPARRAAAVDPVVALKAD